jgi:hypothetical protein
VAAHKDKLEWRQRPGWSEKIQVVEQVSRSNFRSSKNPSKCRRKLNIIKVIKMQ